jgi:hypothetical protein
MLISSIACGKSDRVMSCLHQRRGGKGARSWRMVALSIGIVISALASTAATPQVVSQCPLIRSLCQAPERPRKGSAPSSHEHSVALPFGLPFLANTLWRPCRRYACPLWVLVVWKCRNLGCERPPRRPFGPKAKWEKNC